MLALLHEQPASGAETQTLRLEYRREVFHAAAMRIRDEFKPDTWQAFWRTAVQQHSVETVAEAMGRSRGSVYTARSRVMKRLKQQVEELDLNVEQPE